MNKSATTKWFKPLFNVENSPSNLKEPKETVYRKLGSTNIKRKAGFASEATINLLDKLAPNVVSDLAVHNKKIEQIENWLMLNVILSEKVSLLLLTGPTGAGKTATVKVLCKSLNIEVLEWENPQDVNIAEFWGPGQTAKFTDFLFESSRYPSLFETNLSSKKIILIEEFPNSIIRSPADIEPILLKFLAKGKSSLIFICTDSNDYHSNISQQLFPQSLRDSIGITVISFNPVSDTLLKSALKRAVSIIQEKYSDTYQIPSQTTIESILNSSMGDIRCALNNFNFACLKGSKDLPIIKENGTPPTGGKRKRKEKGTLANMCKDQYVGLFHGVGRVLYPKRIQIGNEYKFQHEPESIFNEFITQPKTLVNFLQENYVRCLANFKDVCEAAEVLSFSELLLSDWKDDDLIAQYGLWISISGLMVVNEKSETKWNPIKGPKYIKNRNEEIIFEERQIKTIEKAYYDIIHNTTKKRFSGIYSS